MENYIKPELEVVEFEKEDVIVTSVCSKCDATAD